MPANGDLPAVAYIASGRLFIWCPGDTAPREVESHFETRVRDRESQDQQRHGWQQNNPLWGSMRRGSGLLAMGRMPAIADQSRATFGTLASGGAGGTLLYTLHTPSITALLEYTHCDEDERRLVHIPGFHPNAIARHPSSGRLAFSVNADDGTANLVVAEPDGRHRQVVTQGDTLDQAPAWHPTQEKLVFASAGVARAPDGAYLGIGPSRIEELDLATGKIQTLLESDELDYVCPRWGCDGSLYAIARPYSPRGPQVSPLAAVLGVLLIPWAIVVTLVHLFNFLTLSLRQKPLADSFERQQQRSAVPAGLILHGQAVRVRRELRRRHSRNPRPLAPKNWQLLQIRQGTQNVLADRVLAYDLHATGVAYSDGSTIRYRHNDGSSSTLCRGFLIQELAVLQT